MQSRGFRLIFLSGAFVFLKEKRNYIQLWTGLDKAYFYFRRKSMFEKFFKFGFISIMFGYLTIIGILITFGLKFLF